MSQISPIAIDATKQSAAPAAPKLGNPAVVGLAGFGLTTLMLQFHNMGLAGMGPIVWLGFFFGGLAQMVAGLQEQKMGNNFGYSAFTSFGCFWISFASMVVAKAYNLFPVNATDVGWFLVAWALYSGILWIASIKVSKAMFITFTLLMIGFALLITEKFTGNEELAFLAGVDLTLCAFGAWYMMASAIYKDLWGRDVLPVGKPFA